MFKNINDLKEFITWAKENKLKSVSIDDIAFEISELSFVEQLEQAKPSLTEVTGDTLVDTSEEMTPEEEDETLFWSSN